MNRLDAIARVSVVAVIGAMLTVAPGSGQELNGKPRLIEAVAPVYPMVAVYSATAGDVRVAVVIDKSGAVTTAKAVDGNNLLRSAAEDAAKRWRFELAAKPQEARLIFSFKILPKGTGETDLSTHFRPPYNIEVRRVIPEPMVNRDPGATVLDKRRPAEAKK